MFYMFTEDKTEKQILHEQREHLQKEHKALSQSKQMYSKKMQVCSHDDTDLCVCLVRCFSQNCYMTVYTSMYSNIHEIHILCSVAFRLHCKSNRSRRKKGASYRAAWTHYARVCRPSINSFRAIKSEHKCL